MSSDNRYNGWTNYETWNLNLWLSNDEGSDSYWRERAEEAYHEAEADSTFTREENAVIVLADLLESETEANKPELQGFYADVLGAAISEVNWHEIAEHYIADVDKEEEETEGEDE